MRSAPDNPAIPAYVSDLQSIEVVATTGRPLRVAGVQPCGGDLHALFLVSESLSAPLCVPRRINLKKPPPQVGDWVTPQFGDVYFAMGFKVASPSGELIELLDWEAPTRYFIGERVTSR